MKEPDKIYVSIGYEAQTKPFHHSIEYLRKDALLEWLQKEYETISWYHKKMQHVTGCVGNTDSSGKAEAYKKVIEKIESL